MKMRSAGGVARVGGEEKSIQLFGMESRKEKKHLENLGTDAADNYKVYLKEIVEWINVVRNSDVWRAVVNAAMNIWVL
jgi:hypothetical protein